MESPIPEYLRAALESVEADDSGAVADYIPELASADPDQLAVAVSTVDGYVYEVGDTETEFSIQSISKPFVYALALADRGFDEVLGKIGVEPTGDAFNDISLEEDTGRPRNPMVNAGAIATHTLAGPEGASAQQRIERILAGLSAFAGRELTVDEEVFESELSTAYRNRALANLLRANDIIADDPVIAVAGYTRQCSVLVTTRDLALMAATLANGGVNPKTGRPVVPGPVVRQVLSVMSTCGMYDGAGDWMTRVGIPAKSGVAGGLIGALPGEVGVATFSPRLDRHGNSVRGVDLFTRFTNDMDLHIMGSAPAASSTIRSAKVIGTGEDAVSVIRLQGAIRFSGAERVVRAVTENPPTTTRVVLELSRVNELDEAASRMFENLILELAKAGYQVFAVDPDGVLDTRDVEDPVVRLNSIEELVPTS